MSPGIFLLEILAELGLPLVRKVMGFEGHILPADLRVWRPIAAWTLTAAPWHQPRGFFRRASGSTMSLSPGLHDGHAWACLQHLFQGSPLPASTYLTIHPATAAALRHAWIPPSHATQLELDFYRSPGRILCIFEADGHWTLLWGFVHDAIIHWISFDGHLAANIVGIIGLDFRSPQDCCAFPQHDPSTCGTVALAHLCWLLHPGFTVSTAGIQRLHAWILRQTHLRGSIFPSGITTLSTDQVNKLVGVPESKAPERAQLIIQKLGAPAIVAAFVAKNSWAHLKSQANKPGTDLRLVHPDELARHAEQIAVKKYGAGISNHKAKKKQDKQSVPAPSLNPSA